MLDDIIGALVSVYQAHFTKSAGDQRIKRVTATVPEAVGEWPWLYFVCQSGDVEYLTFVDPAKTATPRAFGAAPSVSPRPNLSVTHQFKAQLLVRPRRDLVEDETLVRPFIQPVITLTAEHCELGGLAKYCKILRYKYGAFPLGQVEQKPVEYLGLEFEYEAQEHI
jgi:hypothetical protein